VERRRKERRTERPREVARQDPALSDNDLAFAENRDPARERREDSESPDDESPGVEACCRRSKSANASSSRGEFETRRTMPEPVDRRGVGSIEVRKSKSLPSDHEVVGDHEAGERTVRKKRGSSD